MQTATLTNWYVSLGTLFGVVEGHPKYPDGTPVRTSALGSLDLDEDGQGGTAVTKNTRYTLKGPPRFEVLEEHLS